MSLKRGSPLCINDVLTDDVLCLILGCVESTKDKEAFGLVCKRWLGLQSTETKKITARAGLHMLRRMSDRFTRLVELDYSQFASHRIYPDITDSDLAVIARGFPCLRNYRFWNESHWRRSYPIAVVGRDTLYKADGHGIIGCCQRLLYELPTDDKEYEEERVVNSASSSGGGGSAIV
ncbi:hypothetical protein glysoja_013575 [Glycine soja]|nr:hypothetical protein glysoja_013575 [Glycine soja]